MLTPGTRNFAETPCSQAAHLGRAADASPRTSTRCDVLHPQGVLSCRRTLRAAAQEGPYPRSDARSSAPRSCFIRLSGSRRRRDDWCDDRRGEQWRASQARSAGKHRTDERSARSEETQGGGYSGPGGERECCRLRRSSARESIVFNDGAAVDAAVHATCRSVACTASIRNQLAADPSRRQRRATSSGATRPSRANAACDRALPGAERSG